ncbi:MltR family transcriptional regulator [Bibersteinia trehalosi]|uniref:Mannitol operon repressor n=1 Tax=Bibersteinia trehalosi USDA-ARS-USMARC-190 TaxID=1263832 RepID=W0R836_BIBTR|nr:MltR family transcriptional regulator [Bibersteinia trehalosi]AHG85563.1 Mannitol operon repressor [Bibersteinia trehalosi USDA-ARS-USMARC-190]
MTEHNDFIEQLSEKDNIHAFLALCCQKIADQIDCLIERVFRKQDFALKSVVDSLFEHQGPLADLSVRLKVLLGLGVISVECYQDLSLLLRAEQIVKKEHSLTFASPQVLKFAERLNLADVQQINGLIQSFPTLNDPNSLQYQMQQMRIEKMVRSCLILTVVELLEALDVESPL